MRKITDNGTLIAVTGSMNDIARGREFFDNGECPLEWGTFWFNYGGKFQAHIHKARKRIAKHKTIEFVLVWQGKVKVYLFNNNKEQIEDVVVKAGGFICLYDGGHSLDVLKGNTKFIEIKNGAFVGTEEDKEKF